MSQQKIVPNLWFDTQAEEAARYYIDVFGDGRVLSLSRYPEGAPGQAGSVMAVDFEVAGMHLVGINGGPQFRFTEAVSLQIDCADQAEVDRFWDRLIGDGGEPSQCGWLKDKYGLSWQVVPRGMDELFADPDPARAARAVQAMLQMTKLDVAALHAAADGVPVG
jgi:predicted 3-demethylubiquinone-9 3-methyltransferase (glyoxalase superfamily)